MNTTIQSPALPAQPKLEFPSTVTPEVDLLRDLPDVLKAITADINICPEDYLTEVLVTGGGE